MGHYAIARVYYVEANNALEAWEDFSQEGTGGRPYKSDPLYQSNCFPITREHADDPDFEIPTIFYSGRPIYPIPAGEEETQR